MAGMRDVLIHSYFGINYNIVWDVVVNYIPPLLGSMNEIIVSHENMPPSSDGPHV